MDTMREALGVIADFRDSERLRQFLLTGQDREPVFVSITGHLISTMVSWRNQGRSQPRFPKRP
jgi:hypothetical protein